MYENLPFEEYLNLSGVSHSDIRNDGAKILPTKKMQLGTHVHNYLLTPESYMFDDISIVREIAIRLKAKLGVLLDYAIPECSVTCDMVVDDFVLNYRGRCDLYLPNRLEIDIKVSEMPLKMGCDRYGYRDQQDGYAAALGVPIWMILRINPKTLEIETLSQKTDLLFWKLTTQKRGKPVRGEWDDHDNGSYEFFKR